MSADRTDNGTPDLAELISTLADEAAVPRVTHEHAEALDYGLVEQFAGCFTSDAVFEIRVPKPIPVDYPTRGGRIVPGAVRYAGRAEIMEFCVQHTHAPEATHRHVLTNAIVELDGDVARCRSYFPPHRCQHRGQELHSRLRPIRRRAPQVGRGVAHRKPVAEPHSIDLRAIRVDVG